MIGSGGRHRRPARRFGGLRFTGWKLSATAASVLVVVGALFAPATVGAQELFEGADGFATLYPECEEDGETVAPSLVVGNFSNAPVEVTAGEVTFTVDAEDFADQDVSAELTADQVLIDGVAGLVEIGSCDDFDFDFDDFDDLIEEQLRSFFTVTFTSGCPADSPPVPARLEVQLSAAGRENLQAAASVRSMVRPSVRASGTMSWKTTYGSTMRGTTRNWPAHSSVTRGWAVSRSRSKSTATWCWRVFPPGSTFASTQIPRHPR